MKMKFYFNRKLICYYLFPGLLFSVFKGNAQISNYSKSMSEKLVNLAWKNNPDNTSLFDEAQARQYLLSAKKISWLNNITLYGNLNEFNLNGYAQNQLAVGRFPRYNFGIIIPLGIIFTLPKEVKAAHSYLDISLDAIRSQKLDIRNQVINKFQQYLQFTQEYQIYNLSTEDYKIQSLAKQKAFEAGTCSLKDLRNSKSFYRASLINILKKRRDLMVTKNDLERLIGVPLSEAIKYNN
jgi:outer membrane protein TolC